MPADLELNRAPRIGRPVDVVIPVYNAPGDLARCVESVLACTEVDHRLLLIDDASPDPGISGFLADLAKRKLPHVLLLHNDVNRGFTATANRGMALGATERRHVVLLNSDTAVTRGWLDAMLSCLADPEIGTVTPFSNNAEICSFPRFCDINAWPGDAEAEQIRGALERAAVPTWPELPTGVGFCMLVRRELLEAIGELDEAAFGRGYGEENDFCLRAHRAGFRNVLCEHAFVRHLGARSFGDDKTEQVRTNLDVLGARHPHYHAMVHDYIAADPLRPLRQAAVLQWRNATASSLGVLHIILGDAQSESAARAMIDAMRDEGRHCLATATDDDWCIEAPVGFDETCRLKLSRAEGESMQAFVGAICATLRIGLVHLHGGRRADEMIEAIRALGLQWGCTIRDAGVEATEPFVQSGAAFVFAPSTGVPDRSAASLHDRVGAVSAGADIDDVDHCRDSALDLAVGALAHYRALGELCPPACEPLSALRVRDGLGYVAWKPPPLEKDIGASHAHASEEEPALGTAVHDATRTLRSRIALRLGRSRAGRIVQGILPRSVIDALKVRIR